MSFSLEYIRDGVRRGELHQPTWIPSRGRVQVQIWCDCLPPQRLLPRYQDLTRRDTLGHSFTFIAPHWLKINPISTWQSDSQESGNESGALYPGWVNSPKDGEDIVIQILPDKRPSSDHRHFVTGEEYWCIDNPGKDTFLWIQGEKPTPLLGGVLIPVGLGHTLQRAGAGDDFMLNVLRMKNPDVRFPDRSDHHACELEVDPVSGLVQQVARCGDK